MLNYLGIAYVIFCIVPLGLALSIALRRQRVRRRIERLQEIKN
jgi:heme exporter protein CcmD